MSSEFPSRDLTWDMGIRAPEQLSRESDAIDSKAMGTFATASLILGLFAALIGEIQLDLSVILFFLATITYLIVLGTSIYILAVRKFKGPDDPTILREDYWPLDNEEARQRLWQHAENAFCDNLDNVTRKGHALRIAIPAFGLEVVFLVSWLLVISFFCV